MAAIVLRRHSLHRPHLRLYSSGDRPDRQADIFKDIKAKFRSPRPSEAHPPPAPLSPRPVGPPPSISEIHKSLSQFRNRDAQQNPSPPPPPISLSEIYRNSAAVSNAGEQRSPTFSWDSIRESLRNSRKLADAGPAKPLRPPSQVLTPDCIEAIKNSVPPSRHQFVVDPAKDSIFGPKRDGSPSSAYSILSTEYNYEQLGKKLQQLRPEGVEKKKNWFSLQELNERLKKIREIDEMRLAQKPNMGLYGDLKDSLLKLDEMTKEQNRPDIMKRSSVFNSIIGGETAEYLTLPPQEHLVQQYFHPDNMSSAEKLKLELKRVRDEFKMSETDCGSARVQIAQLTTKIKHLSSVLHKKDKHSRKGLQDMVQRRKKLLKYLRRTDWDSYTLVLSKLGIRDTPKVIYRAKPPKARKS